jgi:undecaprenyl-diphosphatase
LPRKYVHAIIAAMTVLTVIAAQYLIFVVGLIAVIATVLSEKATRNNIIKLVILSFGIAFLIAYITGRFYYDTRPFVIDHIKPLMPHQPDNGFPSDYTLAAIVTAAVIFVYRHKLGILLAVLGVFIGIARIAARLHHPIDIVGSILIAVVATGCAWMILKKSGRRFRPSS